MFTGSCHKARPNPSEGKGNDINYFVGLDVSLASTSICVLDEKGKIVTEARVASAPEALVAFLSKLPHRVATVGLEAGPLPHWLYKGMTDAGFETVLMETRQVKGALKAMPIKTDHRVAEGMAILRHVHSDENFATVHHGSPSWLEALLAEQPSLNAASVGRTAPSQASRRRTYGLTLYAYKGETRGGHMGWPRYCRFRSSRREGQIRSRIGCRRR